MPYFRIQWRLALHPVCAEHGVVLRDSCECGAPVQLHRRAIEEMLTCSTCGLDMRATSSKSVTVTALRSHKVAMMRRPGDRFSIGGLTMDYCQWLSLIRVLWRLCADSRYAEAFWTAAGTESDGDDAEIHAAGTVELSRSHERAVLLPRAYAIAASGVPGIVGLCRGLGITQMTFIRRPRGIPSMEVVDAIADQLAQGPSRRRRAARNRPRHERVNRQLALSLVGLERAEQTAFEASQQRPRRR